MSLDSQGPEPLPKRIRLFIKSPRTARSAAFFMLGALAGMWVPFYPVWMALFFGLLSAVIGYSFPLMALIADAIFVTGAAGYQSPEFGLVFLVLSLVLLFASLYDWKFGFIVFAAIYGSRFGLSLPILLAAAAIYPMMLSLTSTMASTVSLMIVASCANVTSVGFFVGAPHTSSFMLFYEPTGAFSLRDMLVAYGDLQSAELSIVGPVMVDNLGASVVPMFEIAAWMAMALAVSFAARRAERDRFQGILLTSVVGFAAMMTFIGSYLAMGMDLPVAGTGASVLLLASAPAALGISILVKEEFRDYFAELGMLSSVGTRVSESANLGRSSFDQVGGLAEVKNELKESIMVPLLRPDLAVRFGIDPPKGILLFGPPGCGKTMLMKALANELKVEMVTVKCSDIMSKWYGESEGKVSELFQAAKARRPAIIFFDDLEAMAKNRDFYGGDDVTPRLLSIILSELDGMDRSSGIVLVGTTNKPGLIDPALLRPGRFDKVIYIPPPNEHERAEILEVHLAEKPVAPDLDLKEIAVRCERFSGADLANMVKEATVLAMRRTLETEAVSVVTNADLLAVVANIKPSITIAMLEDYELLRLDYERKMHTVVREDMRGPSLRWSDIIGAERTKRDIRDYMEVLLHTPEIMEDFRLRAGRGLLIVGPHGCGKSLIARAAAHALDIPIQRINCAELVSIGDGTTVKEVFHRARENAPAMILLEDLEAIASSSEGAPEARTILGQLLGEIDGIGEREQVLIVATTHMPDTLQASVLRPGRFDKLFYVPPPDRDSRKGILELMLRDVPKGADIDDALLSSVASKTDGYSSADLASIVDEAKLIAVVNKTDDPTKQRLLSRRHLERAVERIKPSLTREELDSVDRFVRENRVRQ
jgi:transitional endoplasmic reticulum ATPase